VKIIKTFFIGLLVIFSSFFVLTPQLVLAQAKEDICKGVALTGGSCDPAAAKGPSVQGIIELTINILSIVVGVIAVIMIIIGGLRYITSGGDSNNITGAKNTILYAIIGLVVVALAQGIVRFVLSRVN